MNKYGMIISGYLVALFLCSCSTVPITERRQFMISSQSSENAQGAAAYSDYKKKVKRSTNTEYNEALARVGRNIKKVAEHDHFDWEFVVLESPDVNAFCLPGGKVAVYTGIMDIMKNEAELACVVGHEAGHAIARHGGERMSWSKLQTLGGLGILFGFRNETLSDIYGYGSNYGVMLPFSRKHEYEADTIGLILMARAGYNPKAAPQFWERCSKGQNASLLAGLMSTHPCGPDRIANFGNHMSTAQDEYRKTKVKRDFGEAFSKFRE